MRSHSEMRRAIPLLLLCALTSGACSRVTDGSFEAQNFRHAGFNTILAFDLRQDPFLKAALLLEEIPAQVPVREEIVLPFSTMSVSSVADIALTTGSYSDYTIVTFASLGSNSPQVVAFVPIYETTSPDSFNSSQGVLYFVADNQERTFAFIPRRAESGSLRERVESLATMKIDAVAVALPGKARPLEVTDSAPVVSKSGTVRFYQPSNQSASTGRVIVKYLAPLTPTQTLIAGSLAKLFPAITAPLVAIFLLKSGQTTDPKKRRRVLIVATIIEIMVIAGLVYYTVTISGAAGVQLGIDAAIVIVGTILTAYSLTLKKPT